ncbi:transposase [Streptomyces jumonjinensis]|uniref:transposase n=1 Tax=Streptomyces jumonjinensis TaxID=1945 RepID=UPI0037964981
MGAPAPEGPGRSGRGGFTTELHLSADGRCRPLSLVVTPGQRADRTRFKLVLERIRVPKSRPGRPRRKPDGVAADKAYGNGPCRQCLRSRGIRHTTPERADSQAARLRKGSRGGRPPAFDEERYRKRNTIERAVNRPKQHRAVAKAVLQSDFPIPAGQRPESGEVRLECSSSSSPNPYRMFSCLHDGHLM